MGVEKLLSNSKVTVFYNDRRPFFLEQRLNRSISIYQVDLLKKGDYVLTPQARVNQLSLENLELIYSWDKWKRTTVKSDILDALIKRDLKFLKSKYHLYKVK